jgi:hypothetical protein
MGNVSALMVLAEELKSGSDSFEPVSNRIL